MWKLWWKRRRLVVVVARGEIFVFFYCIYDLVAENVNGVELTNFVLDF